MKDEKNSVTKLKFRRMLGKKWMYPAIHLSIAALVLAGVLWYQQRGNDLDLADQPNGEVNDEVISDDQYGEDAVPVMESQEKWAMPVADEAESTIVTKFYDYNASEEDQESALVLYNNKYYQSTGVDFTKNDEVFDVTAALSGQVTEVKEDPLYGNVVKITHENDVTTVYASLDEVQVEAGTEVSQGDVLGTSGRNIFGQASGVHVHFEVRKGDQALNPETFFGKPISDIENTKEESTEEQDNKAAEEDNGEQDPASEEDTTPGEGEEGNDTEEDTNQGDDGVADDTESSISMTQT